MANEREEMMERPSTTGAGNRDRPDPLEQRNLLEREVGRLVGRGWEVLDRTSDSVHLRRHRRWRRTSLTLLGLFAASITAAFWSSLTDNNLYLWSVACLFLFLFILEYILRYEERRLVSLRDLERREQIRRRRKGNRLDV